MPSTSTTTMTKTTALLAMLIAIESAQAAASFLAVQPTVSRSSYTRSAAAFKNARLFLAADGSASESTQDKVAALRAAAQKARDEADRLSVEMGKTPTAAAAAVIQKKRATANEIVTFVQSNDWMQVAELSPTFGSASLRTFPLSMSRLEATTGLTAQSLGLDDGSGAQNGADLDDLKWATVIVALGSAFGGVGALAFLPPNIGATVCYLIALVPILFLGIGSTAPGLILDVIGAIKGAAASSNEEGDKANAAVSQRERMVRHEAAHLCCGYWCGLPVNSYSVDDNGAQVEFGSTSPPPYNPTLVAALAVTGLAGLVGEATTFGSAKYGSSTQDLLAVDEIFRKGTDFYGAAAQQDLTRWAAYSASLLLKQNAAKYERVATAMSNNAPLTECVAILEE